ncbi:MAG: hypothetical protein WC378_09065 [Opitutaceae bacterium]|jgi:hypothetical protein
MKSADIIERFRWLESQIDVQDTLKAEIQSRIDELMGEQAELATNPYNLEELSPLRDGQLILLSNGDNSPATPTTIISVQQLIIDEENIFEPCLACFAGPAGPDGMDGQIYLDLQPGKQWRYPADSTPAPVAAPQEVRS